MQINCENSLIVFLISFLIWSTVILKNIFMISKYFICMNFRYILIFLCSWVISSFAFNKTAIFNACCSCFFISIIYFFVWSLKTYSESFSPMKKKSNENSESEIANDSNELIVDRRRLYFENDWKNWTLNWSKKKVDEYAKNRKMSFCWKFEMLLMINIDSIAKL